MKFLKVRSRNKSCAPLRLLTFPGNVVYRMGSVTPLNKIYKKIPKQVLEINSVQACLLSSNKILMKKRFQKAKVCTAKWFTINDNDLHDQRIKFYLDKWDKIIAKRYNSSKGNEIYLITSYDDYIKFCNSVDKVSKYVFEKYYTYTKEYRIHVTKNKCFYASRKMLIKDAQDRWHRHGNNSVFINEENPLFDKPENWNEIVKGCINALKSLGLDIAAFDVKVSKKGEYIIMESNSAPALGEQGIQKYIDILKEYINERL